MKHFLALLLIKIGTLVLIGISVFGMYWGFRYMGFSPFWSFVFAVAILLITQYDEGWPALKALKHPFSRYWSRSN